MSSKRPHVLIACSQTVRNDYLDPVDLERLETFATWSWHHGEGGGGIYETQDDPEQTAALATTASLRERALT